MAAPSTTQTTSQSSARTEAAGSMPATRHTDDVVGDGPYWQKVMEHGRYGRHSTDHCQDDVRPTTEQSCGQLSRR
eukprot:4882995-Pyramimonas_sp.AAC.1